MIPFQERIDRIADNMEIIQCKEVFSFSVDAVLLASFVKFDSSVKKAIDLGTGTGIIPLLLSRRYPYTHITGLEIQERLADMSRRSVELNVRAGHLKPGTIEIVQGDLREAVPLFGHGVFDAVVSNPPYMDKGIGEQNPNPFKAIARHEIHCNLEDVCHAASRLVKSGGKVFIVYRALRLAELMVALKTHHLEPKRMRLVAPKAGKEPNIVLIEAVKDRKPGLRIEPTLVVHDDQDGYTAELLAMNPTMPNSVE